MSLDALPPLREVVARHDLAARKPLGQHFLFDLNLTAKIARLAEPLADATVLEVGPGPGGLTRALLAAGAHVIAIEKDPRFADALEELATASVADGHRRLRVVAADALNADEPALIAQARPGPAAVVANLPYNVGTALLVKWLTGPRWWSQLVLMFQKEVAERVVAAPGDAAYGRLAVLTALRAEADLAFVVPARAFTPPPKVESAVVRLTPLPAAPEHAPGGAGAAFADVATLGAVTAAAFGQRRKMLRRSLKGLAAQHGRDLEAWLAAAGVAGDQRPEDLPPDAFARLSVTLRSDAAL